MLRGWVPVERLSITFEITEEHRATKKTLQHKFTKAIPDLFTQLH